MSPEVVATMRAALLSAPALLVGAMLADWSLGEPPPALHPVVWMGGVTRAALRAVTSRGPLGQLAAGAVIALGVPSLFAGGAALGLRAVARGAERVLGAGIGGGLVTFVVAVWLLKSTFALRALGAAARTVATALGSADLAGARRGLGSLCSRDAAALDERALIAGTVESLAENASDSVIAPLFYFALFGLPGALFYRAVNTLDAMIGYHGRYEYLGKAAARLDDLLNLAPARLTSLLLLIAGALLGLDARRGWRVLRRDGGRTESPNAGHPMAAMAGLLGVALEKRGHYRLGDPVRPLAPASIASAWRVVVLASVLALAIVVAIATVASAGATALPGPGPGQGRIDGR